MTANSTIHHRTCHLCEAMCGVELEVRGSEILKIRGDTNDLFSRGHICPKAIGLREIHVDPDRLRRPMRRVGDRWHEIDWAEALDETATRLRDIQREHGNAAVAGYLGNPNVHNYGSLMFGPLLLRTLNTPSLFSATSLDQLPHMLASQQMFGHQLLLPVPDLDRTDFLLMIGANPLVSNGSLMTAGNVGERLGAIQERGGRIVVVDPVRTRTAAMADQHIAIRPATDALLLAAILHEVFRTERVKLGRLAPHVRGIETVAELAGRFTPAAVADRTGVAADAIRALAADFCAAPTAACYGRMGACTQSFGGVTAWLINVLNIATGRLDEPGGMMFPRPAVDLAKLHGRGSYRRRTSRVSGLPAFGSELPTVTLAEEIETAGAGQIRALVTSAGNPVLSAPNGRRIERALAQLDFMVSIDIYRNETTRFAHIILPPTFGVEHDHYDLAFHGLAVRNTAKYSPALFPRDHDTRHDWEIFLGLATRLRAGARIGGIVGRAVERLGPLLEPSRILDLLIRTGPHGAGFRPGRSGLTLAKLRRAPHGVDLGPLAAALPQRLYTANRVIELAPSIFTDDARRLRDELTPPSRADGELLLIGRRDLRTNNSWMHNLPALMRGRDRCTLLIHPDDAGDLRNGQKVSISTDVGNLSAAVEITDDIRPGVVSLPHGWGHDREGTQIHVASAHPGVNINDLIDDRAVDPMSGTAAFSGIPVRIDPA